MLPSHAKDVTRGFDVTQELELFVIEKNTTGAT
jgi:hypothetical protein